MLRIKKFGRKIKPQIWGLKLISSKDQEETFTGGVGGGQIISPLLKGRGVFLHLSLKHLTLATISIGLHGP